MKKLLFLSSAVIILSVSIVFAAQSEHSYKPKDGYVPDAATSIKIAEAVLMPIYGEKVINEEKPLKAELKDGVWVVEGTLHCPGGNPDASNCVGGVAIIEISKDDGKILKVSHGK